MTHTSRSLHFSIRKKNISGVGHRQGRPVAQLDTNWFVIYFCRDEFWCLTRSYLDNRILDWCPDLSTSLLVKRILISYPILTRYGTRLQDTLKMRSQRNSSSLLSQKERLDHMSLVYLLSLKCFLLQLNNNWGASSFSIDECIRLVKTMMSRDFSSDGSCCHRINLHDLSQEKKITWHFFINSEIDPPRRDGSSYTECFQVR